MPEYLAPGVYIEETSFRSKSIEGVGTSTTGFVGATRYGPVEGEPELMTSFNQFARIYGGLDPLAYDRSIPNYLAHAVRGFFDNGGSRLYVVRAYTPPDGGDGIAQAGIPAPAAVIDEADGLVTSSTAQTLAYLSQAIAEAQKAKAATIAVFQYAAAQVFAGFSVPVTTPPNYDYGTGDNLEMQLDASIAEDGQDAALFTAELRTLVQAADTVYGNDAVTNNDAVTLLNDAATTQGTVAGAATLGIQAGEAVSDGALPDDAAAQSAAAIAPLNTDLTAVTTAQSALAVPSTALDTALLALATVPTATTVVNAANDLLTQAREVVTRANAVVVRITNAAEAVTIGRRAALRNAPATFAARFPGAVGDMKVTVTGRLATNALSVQGANNILNQVRSGELVVIHQRTAPDTGNAFIYSANSNNGAWSFTRNDGSSIALTALTPPVNPNDPADLGDRVYPLFFTVQVEMFGKFTEPIVWDGLTISSETNRLRDSLNQIFSTTISNRLQALETPLILNAELATPESPGGLQPSELAGFLLNITDWHNKLISSANDRFISSAVFNLTGGSDGQIPEPEAYLGNEDANTGIKSGLLALEDLEEISIVGAPGCSHSWASRRSEILTITQQVISHCEKMRYRVAVLDSPDNQSLSGIREYRALLDTTRAALYYPWVTVLDPISEREINLPPSGFVAGIYARSDVEIGVHKAPANEVVRGAIALEMIINKAQQDILNPLGINCIRFFEGRGIRVWGARTISSDPEWKYLNIRRYFAYLGASIDRSTQWAVFEPNGHRLWANIRRTVESFLDNEWREGRLAGAKVEDAFFVRCDRSTMTQNDIDNGRLICLIGVAPLYPAEFVIFRIGQYTADRR